MRRWLPLLALACACAAQADAVSDLKAKLETLRASTPIKGVLEADYQEFDDKGMADKAKTGHLQFGFDTKDGLSLHLGPELIQSLSTEEAKNVADADSPTPLADLLRQMSTTHMQHVLSAADALLRDMQGALSSSVKAATVDGAAVTQLDFQMPFKAPKKDADAAKDWQDVVSIWADAQGVPLRFQEKIHGKFCKFLLCVTVDQNYGGTERVVDGRLVTVTSFQETQQSGLGQESHNKTTSTLQLQ